MANADKMNPEATLDESAAPAAGDAAGRGAGTLTEAASPDRTEPESEPETESLQRDPQDQAAQADDELADLPVETLREQLRAMKMQNTEIKDALLRARAEVENIRKRSQNEIVTARKFAIEGFAQELLGVRDSLDRAAAVELDAGAGEAVHNMKEGLGLTLKQFDLALARFAVAEVEAGPGVRFDPERHQAISAAPSADVAPDHIIAVVQKGFLLKERLLRPAMVVVAAGANSGGKAS